MGALLGFRFSLLLGLGFGAGLLGGALLELDALGLRFGLDSLGFKVGGDGGDVGGVDVDEGVDRVVGAFDFGKGGCAAVGLLVFCCEVIAVKWYESRRMMNVVPHDGDDALRSAEMRSAPCDKQRHHPPALPEKDGKRLTPAHTLALISQVTLISKNSPPRRSGARS